MEGVSLPDGGVAHDDDMAHKPIAAAKANVWADHAERTDFNIISELSPWIDGG
jgi:hypothetical protein